MFQTSPDDLDMHVIYDVSHNIAKIEQHWVEGKLRTLLVHRKVSFLFFFLFFFLFSFLTFSFLFFSFPSVPIFLFYSFLSLPFPSLHFPSLPFLSPVSTNIYSCFGNMTTNIYWKICVLPYQAYLINETIIE